MSSMFLEEYITPLLAGNRVACREYVRKLTTGGVEPISLYNELLWPAMERVDKLFRADRINAAAEHMATRINRIVVEQLQSGLTRAPANGKRMIVTCADGEPEELGAQMSADLFEAQGWEVYFVGGGVPNDEILSLVGRIRPDLQLIFGTQPAGVPGVRKLIDMIHGVGGAPTMNIMVSGGVFTRADGLWKEVNADLYARSIHEALSMAASAEPRVACERPAGPMKKRRRRRRALAEAGA